VSANDPMPPGGSAPGLVQGLTAAAPEFVFIQACGDCSLFGPEHCDSCTEEFVASEDVTWCGERIFDSDVKYLRYDLAVQLLRECIQSPAGVMPEAVRSILGGDGGGEDVSRQDELAS